jgi:predicted DsbA family dithiol-disulfide isomerase
MKKVSITVVSDVVCPFCLIGAARLDAALAEVKDQVSAEVRYVPFLLAPDTPKEGVDLRDSLRKKYGGDPERMFGNVEAMAREVGVNLDFSKVRRSVNTVRAHVLLVHAEEKGTQKALAMALFRAYFLEGLDVNDDAVLLRLATANGFDEEEAKALLANEEEAREVREIAASMAQQGISGVPFFVFADKYAISGAQPLSVFKQAIERAAAEAPGA